MSVKMTTRQVGDVTVIDAVGRITLGDGASTFRDTIRNLAAGGQKKLLLNLAEGSAKPSPKDRARYYSIAFASFRESQVILSINNQVALLKRFDNLGGCLYKLSRPA